MRVFLALRSNAEMTDRAVEALKILCGTTRAKRLEIADALGVNEQSLYQITAGVPLESGKPRTVGRKLRELLDQTFPEWLDAVPEDEQTPTTPRPTIKAAVSTLANRLAQDMPDDVRSDVAHLLSQLAQWRGTERHQALIVGLLEPFKTPALVPKKLGGPLVLDHPMSPENSDDLSASNVGGAKRTPEEKGKWGQGTAKKMMPLSGPAAPAPKPRNKGRRQA